MNEHDKEREQEHESEEPRALEDLDVPESEGEDVKGGVAAGDVTGDGPAALGGDPDQPIVAGTVPRKIPGLHKSGDVALKRG